MFSTSTKLKWINLSFLFLCFSNYTNGQIQQTRRMEIPIKHDHESHRVITLDTAGIILFRSFSGPKGNQLELTRLDTALQVVWTGYLPFPNGFTFIKAKAADSRIYFFFRGGAKNLEYSVIVSNPLDGSYYTLLIQNQVPFNPSEFIATTNAILIGGYFNFRPIVLHYSTVSKKTRVLPGFLNEPGELIQIKNYPDGNIDVVISAKNALRKKCVWIRHFDKEGDLIKTVVVEPEENKNLIYGRVTNLVNDNQVVAGVYGRNTQYARGVFIADVNPYGEYIIHYYNFAELKNFFHYMKARREQRIKERIHRRKIKGKKTRFNYRLMVHELIPYKDHYIMLGEAFFPHYTNRSFGAPLMNPGYTRSYGMTNLPYNSYRTDMVFDGYEYTHAVVVGVDKNANILWDNSFEIHGIKVYQLEQFVKIFPGQEHILLAYLYENQLRSKIIQGNEVIEGTLQSPLKTNENEKEIDTRQSKLEYWYHNHFFIYGIQSVVSSDETHQVFFINKLRVR